MRSWRWLAWRCWCSISCKVRPHCGKLFLPFPSSSILVPSTKGWTALRSYSATYRGNVLSMTDSFKMNQGQLYKGVYLFSQFRKKEGNSSMVYWIFHEGQSSFQLMNYWTELQFNWALVIHFRKKELVMAFETWPIPVCEPQHLRHKDLKQQKGQMCVCLINSSSKCFLQVLRMKCFSSAVSLVLCVSSRAISLKQVPHFPRCIHCLWEASTSSTMLKTGLAEVTFHQLYWINPIFFPK